MKAKKTLPALVVHRESPNPHAIYEGVLRGKMIPPGYMVQGAGRQNLNRYGFLEAFSHLAAEQFSPAVDLGAITLND